MISVVICTHNRVDYLEASIRSVFEQEPPVPGTELIVVDNASGDGTAELLDRLASDAPDWLRFRPIHESQLGLSFARNTGIEHAEGTVVAFLDDDAVAQAGWLEGVDAGFQRERRYVVTGPIEPIWPTPPPWWLNQSVWSYYTVLDFGPDPCELHIDTHYFAGANLAFDAEALRSIDGFPTHLGRRGTMLLSNEDRDVVHQLAAAGGLLGYEPAARVRHHVHPDRMSLRWLFRRAFWQGVSDALADVPPDEAEPVLTRLGASSRRTDGFIVVQLVRSWTRRAISKRTVRVPIKTLVNQVSQRSAARTRRMLNES